MPDLRVTELPLIDAVVGSDLLMVIDDPAGTPSNKKALVSQLGAALATGPHHTTHEPGGSDALVNAAWVNLPNVFTQNQTLLKIRPELVLQTPGDTTKTRLLKPVAGARLDLTTNLSYAADGNWNRDDVSLASGLLTIFADGHLGHYIAAAGANPVSLFTSPFQATVDGDVIAGRHLKSTADVISGAAVISTTYVYPGLYPSGGQQTSYYLAGSTTYGLHSNTGLHLVGSLWTDANLNVTGSLSISGAVNSKLTLLGGSGTPYHTAPIEVQLASNPRISFHWPGVVASQLGMDSAGTIRTFDNPGTGFAPFAASSLTLTSGASITGTLTVNAVNVNVGELQTTGGSGGALVTSGLIYPASVTTYTQQRSYYLSYHPSFTGLYTNGNICAYGVLMSYGYVYPGRNDGSGTYQLSWYIAGHSSYGLYINTGLYVVGSIWSPANFYVGGIGGWLGNAAIQNGLSGTMGSTVLFNGVYVTLVFTNGVLTSTA